MFEVSEPGEQSDYLAEVPPKDFEVLAEDVLVLQSREFEMGDVEFIMESIQSSLVDLMAVSYHRAKLEAAKVSESFTDRIRAMSDARGNRERLQARYGSAVILTKESAVNLDSPTFALEEEEAKERGLFRRILDKIIAGFKWLWEKLAGLFASGDDPEKNQEKIDASVKEIEEAVASGVELKDIDTDTAGIRAAFGFLGNPVTASALTEHLTKMAGAYAHLERLMNAGTHSYDIMIKTLRGIDAGTDRFEAVGATIINTIRGAASGLEHGSSADLSESKASEATKFASFLSSHSDLDVFKLTHFVGDGMFMIAVSKAMEGKGLFSSVFIPGKKDFAAKVKIDAFEMPDIKAVQIAAGKLSKVSKDTGVKLSKIVKENAARQNSLKSATDLFADSKTEGTSAAAQFLFDLGGSISELFIQAQAINSALRGSNNEVMKYLEQIRNAIKKAKKAEKETE